MATWGLGIASLTVCSGLPLSVNTLHCLLVKPILCSFEFKPIQKGAGNSSLPVHTGIDFVLLCGAPPFFAPMQCFAIGTCWSHQSVRKPSLALPVGIHTEFCSHFLFASETNFFFANQRDFFFGCCGSAKNTAILQHQSPQMTNNHHHHGKER